MPATTNDQAVHFALNALSPLDGRYADKTRRLAEIFSERNLMRCRLKVEGAWLTALSSDPDIKEVSIFSSETIAALDDLVSKFSTEDGVVVKQIEKRTNHDVKAIEYFLKETLKNNEEIVRVSEFIHFACTSEDINNVSYALMLEEARQKVMLPKLRDIIKALRKLAHDLAAVPMLARTHGQAASPTTMGKEIANVVSRLERAYHAIEHVRLTAKMNGAVGNYNAHVVAYPEIAWELVSSRVVKSLGFEWSSHTTQIEPHDTMAELFDAYARANTILLDFCRDMWGYIAIGYFKQKPKPGEVGSSTMPHKVNPIDFENAEGNIGVANSLLRHFSEKLPVSRWQRDLSDSTVIRNNGVALGHTLLAYDSCLRGLGRVEADEHRMKEDLYESWEVLAEPIQTVMRRYGVTGAYEQLKELTRGQKITRADIQIFLGKLESIPQPVRDRLFSLTPASYIGKAAELARKV